MPWTVSTEKNINHRKPLLLFLWPRCNRKLLNKESPKRDILLSFPPYSPSFRLSLSPSTNSPFQAQKDRQTYSVPIHRHALRMPTQLPIRTRTNRPTPTTPHRTIILERLQLLGPKRLVMNLARRLDQILQMRTRQKVAQAHKLAMALVLDINHAPAVLAAPHAAAVDDDVLFGADDRKGDEFLDALGQAALLVVVLVAVVGEHAQVVEGEFVLDALLEGGALVEREGVGFGDDGDDVDDVGEFLEDDDVDWFEAVFGEEGGREGGRWI